MTYKNIKFEDSPVMRSLEKLAVKKGLVKPEAISKTAASKQLSLKPTENLEENILKLCSALRASGFEKHAAEVETKFFNLKRAQALYGTTGETGEDVINTAHPEGSHQMKDVDGDALVETILDRQKAIQKMVAKVPTGKLGANALANIVKNAGKLEKKDAINALKVILAQAPPIVPDLVFPTAPAATGIGATVSNIGATTVGGGAAGAAAAITSAVLIGAIGGGLLGSWLFDRLYSVTDVSEAGERLVSEAGDVENKWTPKEFVHVTRFNSKLPEFLVAYKDFKENISKKLLSDAQKINNLIYGLREEASTIWSYAQIHKDDEIFGALRGFGDVVAASANFTKICDKIIAVNNDFMSQAASELKTQEPKGVDEQANNLINQFKQTISKVDEKINVLQTTKPQNYTDLVKWLNKVNILLRKNLEEFSTNKNKANKDILQFYTDNFNKINSKLKAASIV